MAKCPICKTKKGKRHCQIPNELICSLCCGNTRKVDLCFECTFYQKPKRNYNEVPSYKVSDMDGNSELEDYGDVIEGALCTYDHENNYCLSDKDVIRMVELLIDRYYFKDQKIDSIDELILNGFNLVVNAIKKDMPTIEPDVLVKILGVIRFVARRRTKTGREYMKVIHRHVGQRIDTGVHLRQI